MISHVLALACSSLAIDHVRVEVGDGRALDDVTVVIDGSRIASVGHAAAPANATHVDGSGKTLTPGFIDVLSTTGVREVDLEAATVDQALNDGVMVPGFRVADGYDALSMRIPVEREEGVTSVVLQPKRGVLSGMGHWVALSGDTLAGPDLNQPVAVFGDVGGAGAQLSSGARGGLWLKLREAFADARWYAKNRLAFEQNRARALSLPAVHLEALQPVIEGKVPLVLNANRAADVLAAIRFGQEQKIRVVISGGAEAYLVSAELKAAKVPVIIVPSEQVPSTFEQVRARDDAATRLHSAGVTVALSCNDSSHRRLRQEAGLAVAYGLPRAKALSAITLDAAKALGLDASLGSVEVGKRADLVLWSGDPLELRTSALKVFVGGVDMSLTTRQSKLVQRYLRVMQR
jgi:imidazolonepropionase-like amidohydrolase